MLTHDKKAIQIQYDDSGNKDCFDKNSVERCLFDLIVKLVLLLRHKGYWIDLIKRGIRMMTFLITPEFDLDC